MKKTLLNVVTAFLFLVFLTAYGSNPTDDQIGCLAPNFVVKNEICEKEIQQMRGSYVLLTFWNSVDVSSRISNMQYDRAVRQLGGIDYVAVNFDRSQGVYNEIVKNDGLNVGSQFYAQDGMNSRLYSRYELGQGMKSLLLDKSGKIIVENPSVQQLKDLVKE
jgi:hypothetical protein